MEFRKSESKPAEVIKYIRAKGVPRSKVIKPKTSSESTTGSLKPKSGVKKPSKPKNSSSKSKKTGWWSAIESPVIHKILKSNNPMELCVRESATGTDRLAAIRTKAIALGAKFKVGGIPSQKLRKELNAKNETKMQEAVTKVHYYWSFLNRIPCILFQILFTFPVPSHPPQARDEGYYSNTVKRNLERQFNLKKKDKKDDRGLDTTSAIGRERDGVLRIRHSLLKD
ncbi:hypothetical protein BJ085DRAFT_31050 [Dimargaris cristalligena]|uniref:Uncharacterized protein n=1 Tax=Dimargaris cristalligena TaxID=215637 RepID=A0A4P9ZUR5_9FUNG|nr:hypothetical protein BJ085DRAFT_31050 [Dimargaris cristalligena]|eukprot:RKP37295.1 hypothetical protein BJ085DRAFT_31050 [Dimargaris cristalligena]